MNHLPRRRRVKLPPTVRSSLSVDPETELLEILVSEDLSEEDYQEEVRTQVREARRRRWITVPLLLPGGLRRAAEQPGVPGVAAGVAVAGIAVAMTTLPFVSDHHQGGGGRAPGLALESAPSPDARPVAASPRGPGSAGELGGPGSSAADPRRAGGRVGARPVRVAPVTPRAPHAMPAPPSPSSAPVSESPQSQTAVSTEPTSSAPAAAAPTSAAGGAPTSAASPAAQPTSDAPVSISASLPDLPVDTPTVEVTVPPLPPLPVLSPTAQPGCQLLEVKADDLANLCL